MEREREIGEAFRLLVHFPDVCEDQSWVRPKIGESSEIPMWVSETQITVPSSTAFPRQQGWYLTQQVFGKSWTQIPRQIFLSRVLTNV